MDGNSKAVVWDVAVGVDWADQKNDFAGDGGWKGEFANSPEGIAEFVELLRARYPGKRVAVCLEQTHGSLIYGLLEYEELVLCPINPAQLASYRKAMQPSGKIDDASDAELLREMLQIHHAKLRILRPDHSQVRSLRQNVQNRRKFVDDRTKLVQQLQAALKKYYPLALEMAADCKSEMFLEFIRRWPTLEKLRRQKPEYLAQFFRKHGSRSEAKIRERLDAIAEARPLVTDPGVVEPLSMLVRQLSRLIGGLNKTIKDYEHAIKDTASKLEETALFAGIRGAGEQLTPRLVATFGTDRSRFKDASELQAYCGIAPVTKKSGKKKSVTRRRACPKFLRQTFHEFAEQMRKFSDWSRAYYEMMRARGAEHCSAIRSLAYKWIRILFAVWKTSTPYSEEKYVEQLRRKNAPLLQYLKSREAEEVVTG